MIEKEKRNIIIFPCFVNKHCFVSSFLSDSEFTKAISFPQLCGAVKQQVQMVCKILLKISRLSVFWSNALVWRSCKYWTRNYCYLHCKQVQQVMCQLLQRAPTVWNKSPGDAIDHTVDQCSPLDFYTGFTETSVAFQLQPDSRNILKSNDALLTSSLIKLIKMQNIPWFVSKSNSSSTSIMVSHWICSSFKL